MSREGLGAAPVYYQHLFVCVHGNEGSPADMEPYASKLKERFGDHALIVNSSSNTKKTMMGIEAGGGNLKEEVLQAVRTAFAGYEWKDIPRLKTTFVCHSLGGMYSRYCVGLLLDDEEVESKFEPLDFITMATPHLGERRPVKGLYGKGDDLWSKMVHGYCNHFLSQTGQDLLLQSSTLFDMSDPSGKFIKNLMKFKHHTLVSTTHYDWTVPYSSSAIAGINYHPKPRITSKGPGFFVSVAEMTDFTSEYRPLLVHKHNYDLEVPSQAELARRKARAGRRSEAGANGSVGSGERGGEPEGDKPWPLAESAGGGASNVGDAGGSMDKGAEDADAVAASTSDVLDGIPVNRYSATVPSPMERAESGVSKASEDSSNYESMEEDSCRMRNLCVSGTYTDWSASMDSLRPDEGKDKDAKSKSKNAAKDLDVDNMFKVEYDPDMLRNLQTVPWRRVEIDVALKNHVQRAFVHEATIAKRSLPLFKPPMQELQKIVNLICDFVQLEHERGV